MRKHYLAMGLIALQIAVLAGCGGANREPAETAADTQASSAENAVEQAAADAPRTIRYLDQDYTVPAKADRIVITGSLEAMEDALTLGVKPIGAMTVGGSFPAMFQGITDGAESIGEKAQPNLESILKLKPDVILGSSKFPPETMEKLKAIGPTFPVSHISTHWEANLRLLAELTGRQEQAEQILSTYAEDLQAAKAQLGEALKDKKAVAIRVRSGNLMIYHTDVFFNPSLYTDLGLPVPDEIQAAKSQEMISLEKFSEINPDIIFLQFAADENKDQPKALEDLQSNPIWQSINAVKNGSVFVNAVDPLAQGGTAWSKIQFLKAAVEKLSK